MSTDQPGDDDPFRKKPQPGEPPSGTPPHAGPPSGDGPPPPPPGGPAYGGPYGSPYGDPYGGSAASDPLAGMPPLGSRGKRLLARIIDALIVGIPVYLIAGLVTGFGYGYDGTADDSSAQYWLGGVFTLVYFVYEGLMLSNSGQTVGKRLMRIRVAILRDGAVPSGSPAWVRAAIYHIPTLIPCIGFLFWLVNVLFCTWDKPFQQCLHDKGARTVVVRAD
ncbi:RDD family protein [Streptomyces sp. TR02-1]|uniref:RDD family protein n=1 Tax=Streptomyces sp. TR02-1 TaxID=3385977 RepID=UPI0039A2996B